MGPLKLSDFVKYFLWMYADDHEVVDLYSINMVYYINLFSWVEATLFSWDILHLVLVQNF